MWYGLLQCTPAFRWVPVAIGLPPAPTAITAGNSVLNWSFTQVASDLHNC